MAIIRGFALLAVGLLLTACSLAGGGHGASATASARAGFGGPSPAASVPVWPSVSSSPSASSALSVSDVSEAEFRTPSGNIFCSLTESAVRCDIVKKSWTPPAKPADCDLDFGNGLFIDRGRAGVTCAGDTLIGVTQLPLAYGESLRAGSVLCTSANSGLTCRDETTGRGFTLATSRYSLF
jgi:hypothetical protein